MKDKDIPSLYIQYHGCRWPGDERSQGISNYDIDLVKPSYIGPCTLKVKPCGQVMNGLEQICSISNVLVMEILQSCT